MKQIIFGAIIGVANIIPGVSGGTMAVILNIYDELIGTISDFKKDVRGSIEYLAPIGIGAVLAILLCSSGINYLLQNHYMIINFFFIGIILGSIPMIYGKAREERFKISYGIPFIIAFAIMIATIVFSDISEGHTIITTLTPQVFIQLVITSAIAAVCMIIPGISGSFVMLLLGVYTTVITAISSFNVLLLMPIGIGVLLGLFGGAKIIDFVLNRYKGGTYFGILGFVFGSIPVLLNNIVVENEFKGGSILIISIVVLIFGMILTLLFDNPKLKKHFETKNKKR